MIIMHYTYDGAIWKSEDNPTWFKGLALFETDKLDCFMEAMTGSS